jgi:hypothetical protein
MHSVERKFAYILFLIELEKANLNKTFWNSENTEKIPYFTVLPGNILGLTINTVPNNVLSTSHVNMNLHNTNRKLSVMDPVSQMRKMRHREAK